jgi:threonylcarbamoyladenosine tRNA methylthiotransferase MtaB
MLKSVASFSIENFGCRAARADGEAVGSQLVAGGMAEVGLAEAGVVVVNTCSVTAEADREARAFVRKARRVNPEAKIVVTGCYAQRAPEEVAGLDGVAAVVGNSHKRFTPEIVLRLAGVGYGQQGETGQRPDMAAIPNAAGWVPAESLFSPGRTAIWADDRFAHSFLEEAQVVPGSAAGQQTRPNLKIQEGCGNRCTFCVIPTTRGASRSLARDKVLAQVRGFVAAGGKELVISGINLGRWGRDLPGNQTLAGLVREILACTGIEGQQLARLRLSSIEPMDWTAGLMELLREFSRGDDARIARHAHLPLQSGSDSVLRRMHRRYRPWHYAEKVAMIREAVGPELALGADVMVGFPGETDAEFRETHDFVSALPYAYLHLFPFSARPGTRGCEMHREWPVPGEVVQERMAALRALDREKRRQFARSMSRRTLPAITLQTPAAVAAKGRSLAITDNYLTVEVDGLVEANRLIALEIDSPIELDVVTVEGAPLRGKFGSLTRCAQ